MEGPEIPASNPAAAPAADHRFQKEHRLSGRTAADRLFSLGQSFGHYPFRFVYHLAPPPAAPPAGTLPPSALSYKEETGNAAQASFLIAVPKRQIKLATGRNRLKRQMREAIRLHFRAVLLPYLPPGTRWEIAIMFTGGKNKFSFAELEKKLISGFKRLRDKVAASNPVQTPLSTYPAQPQSLPPNAEGEDQKADQG